METVHDATAADGLVAAREALAVGLDGFLYGTALLEGAHRAGTVFRVDPSTSQFQVINFFPQNLHTWKPSVPVRVANGDLYGTTSHGDANLRGSVYRIDGTTSALTILGPIPGAVEPSLAGVNSALVLAPDGLLYGTARDRILRVDPSTGGIATAALAAIDQGPLTLAPNGELYLVIGGTAWRFNRGTGVFSEVASLPSTPGAGFASRLVVGSDGQLYAAVTVVQGVGVPQPHRAELARLDLASNAIVTVASLGTFGDGVTPPPVVGTPVAAPNGTLLVPLWDDHRGVRSVLEVTPATGAVRPVCAPFGLQTTLGADGLLYGVDGSLRRCDPATGVTVEQPLLDSVGAAQAPPALLAGVVHGATVGGLYGGGTVFRLNGGGLPALDTDGDGLPNAWEPTYGLDPFDATGDDGAGGDPDGDGRTNAQELADGTHPRGRPDALLRRRRDRPVLPYADRPGNPTRRRRRRAAALPDRRRRGSSAPRRRAARPRRAPSIRRRSPGLAHASFSTIIESDVAVVVDRTMSLGRHRLRQPPSRPRVAAPSTTWYFAEGSTSGDFVAVLPAAEPAGDGGDGDGPLPAAVGRRRSRRPTRCRRTAARRSPSTTEGPELASTDVSAVITATAPIIAERAMYSNRARPAVRGRPRQRRRDGAGARVVPRRRRHRRLLRSVRAARQPEPDAGGRRRSSTCCPAAAP